jgi:hypothetical protein
MWRKMNDQQRCKRQKDDPEKSCITPASHFFNDLRMSLLRNQMECSEDKLHRNGNEQTSRYEYDLFFLKY